VPEPALPVHRLHPEAVVPTRAHPGDAGLDLVAVEEREMAPGARVAVPTGLAIAIPVGFAGLVLPRSGLARRHGVTLTNSPGLIDAGYRGELTVLMVNLGQEAYTVRAGDRIAQLVLIAVSLAAAVEVDALPESDGRGAGGFGSTGGLTA